MTMYRQGDILLVAIDAPTMVPGAVPRDERGRIVLALGEATGHAHAIHDRAVTFHQTTSSAFLLVDEPEGANLVHEEHATIHLPPGAYRVVRQREFVSRAVSWDNSRTVWD